MSEETKCPKCGAEEAHDCEICKSFKCDSALFKDGTFNQTESCELSTLRAELSKAVEALKPFGCVKPWECLNDEEMLALNLPVKLFRRANAVLAELSTTRAESGDL